MQDQGRSHRLECVAFLAVCLIQAAPVFCFQYFPNSDGPAHAATGAVLNQYSREDGVRYRQYLTFRRVPPPNLLGHLMLAGLLRFMSSIAADKVMAAFLIIAFPWAVRWALAAWTPHFRPYSALALPFAAGWFVHMGFQNFTLSVLLFFFTLGVWLRERASPRRTGIPALAALLLLQHFSHVVGLILLLLTIGGVIGWEALRSSREPGPFTAPGFLAALWTKGRRTALAALPAAALTGHYLLTNSGSAVGERLPLLKLAGFLATMGGPILCFSDRELMFSIPIALLIAILAARALRTSRTARPGETDWTFLILAAASTALYLAAPDESSGGSLLSRRLTLFPAFFLIFWASRCPLDLRADRSVRILSIACALGLLLIRLPAYCAFDRDLAEFQSAGRAVPPHATYAPLMLIRQRDGDGGTGRSKYTFPLDSAADHLMTTEGRLDLAHYESSVEGFWTLFRPELDPSRHLGRSSTWAWTVPPECDLLSYPSKTTGQVDYVLLWGRCAASEDLLRSPPVVSLLDQLARGYRRILVSEPRGLMEVYERRKEP